MKHHFLISLSIVLMIAGIACNSPKREAQRIVKEWIGKEVILPEQNLTYKIMGRDTSCTELWNKPYKIFVYIDSIGCISCRLGLAQWKEIIDSSRVAYPDLGFLFVVHAGSYKRFEYELRDAEFNYPVIYDYRDEFHKKNNFAPDPYRTFLLDRNNKIILIGSPVRSPQIWELYKKVLAGT